MECPNIDEIKFSQPSIDAIEEIRSYQSFIQSLALSTGLGTWATIFTTNKSFDMTISLVNTDFAIMGEALKALSTIEKSKIRNAAGSVYNTYFGKLSYAERQFWKAIYSGCGI